MVDVPAATPVTTPEPLTVAALGFVLLHAPPIVVLDSVVEFPTQNDNVPEIADGNALTVTTAVT
jgi:hypothetical protein